MLLWPGSALLVFGEISCASEYLGYVEDCVVQLKDLVGYCSAKEGASMEFPFGKVPICFKFRGRIFAEIYPNEDDYKMTLRCSPEMGEYFREAFPENVVPAFHVPLRQRRHKFTVLLRGSIEARTIYSMIDHSYATLEA